MKTPLRAPSTPSHRRSANINLTLPVCALAMLTFALPARANEEGPVSRAPQLPSPVCDGVGVPAGNRVSFHVYASGVQIYRWNGSSWAFVGPEAALFADPCYEGQVGVHYAGPVWAANDGSQVTAARVADCTPFRGAIPWLLLDANPLSDRGIFAGVTYIQRVNTVGGTAPAPAGAYVGDEARVPYTAEYYFYRATQP